MRAGRSGKCRRGIVGPLPAAVFAVLCLVLASCKSGPASSDGAAGQSPSASSPASSSGLTTPAAPAAAQGVVQRNPPAVAPGTNKMLTDPASAMVYLPETGWLTQDQFWDVYFHHPDKLTVELDFPALTAMGYQRPDQTTGGSS